MDNLEPITRNEMFLNGDDLEPITREEMILAGEDLEPITRHEWFLKKYRGGGGGGGYDLVNIPDLPADIASFTDGTDLPMASLKVTVTPYQDLSHGDPSPENICPIIGWEEAVVNVSGVNVWDEEWEVGGINHTTGQNTETTGTIRSKNYIMVKGNTNYNFLKKTNGIDFHVHWYDADKNFISYEEIYTNNSINYKVATSPQNAVYMRFNLTAGYGATYNNDISINYPSTDTEYHAYSGTTYTIPFTDSQGQSVEVFGGTLDVTSGVLTVDRAYVDLGTLNWTYANGFFRTLDLTSTIKRPANNYAIVNAISSMYNAESWNAISGTSNGKFAISAGTNDPLIVCNTDYTDATAFKQAMNGVQLVYELATPITVQLAPTPVKSLEGVNKIYANCGQITEAKYFKKA